VWMWAHPTKAKVIFLSISSAPDDLLPFNMAAAPERPVILKRSRRVVRLLILLFLAEVCGDRFEALGCWGRHFKFCIGVSTTSTQFRLEDDATVDLASRFDFSRTATNSSHSARRHWDAPTSPRIQNCQGPIVSPLLSFPLDIRSTVCNHSLRLCASAVNFTGFRQSAY